LKRRILVSGSLIYSLLFGTAQVNIPNFKNNHFNSTNQTTIERVLKIYGGDLNKNGPGPRAKADAQKASKINKNNSYSTIFTEAYS
jgi:hypothetical protein